MGRQRKVPTKVHDFYCLRCGNKGIPLPRRLNHIHEKHHRKKLYCIYCQAQINHIECRTPKEIEEFKQNFLDGKYEDEADLYREAS